jgi:hypothetical protein
MLLRRGPQQQQQTALGKSFRSVHAEYPHRRAPDLGDWLNKFGDETKMIEPAVLARME